MVIEEMLTDILTTLVSVGVTTFIKNPTLLASALSASLTGLESRNFNFGNLYST